MSSDWHLNQGSVAAEPAPNRRHWQVSVWGLLKLVLVLAVFFGLATVFNRRERPTEHARRVQCANNLKQIALALHSYHERYGELPPAYVADQSGRPMHSWRVLLLPFLNSQSVYDAYDFREPWNGPHNIKLLSTGPGIFCCPSQPPTTRFHRTNYCLVTGPGTMFPGKESIRLDDVTDGLEETLMLVEVANTDIPWTAPTDLDVRTMSVQGDASMPPHISSKHVKGAQVAAGVGGAFLLNEDLSAETLRALMTIAGGERIHVKALRKSW